MPNQQIRKRSDREALAAFLRSHRSKLCPFDVGLPHGSRRRTPGLRREEVAQLAGVGATWYTWLEQAKNIQVSTHFLERLSQALRLNSAERKHLFALCQVPLLPRSDRPPEVSESVRRLLETLPGPAYVHTLSWDLVYWNKPSEALFGDLSWVPLHERNVLRLVFLDERVKSRVLDWDWSVRALLARFRLDTATCLASPAVAELIEYLKEKSPLFREWWSKPDVVDLDEQPRSYFHPGVGKLTFLPATLTVDHVADMRVRVFTSKDDQTAERMRELVREMGSR